MSDKKENHVGEFNKHLRILFDKLTSMESKLKNKISIKATKEQMMSGIRKEPKYMIMIMGPFLWNSRQNITNENTTYFLEKRYDADLMRLSKFHKFDYEDSVKAVEFVKDAFYNAKPKKQKVVVDLIQQLLTIYSKYTLSQSTQ